MGQDHHWPQGGKVFLPPVEPTHVIIELLCCLTFAILHYIYYSLLTRDGNMWHSAIFLPTPHDRCYMWSQCFSHGPQSRPQHFLHTHSRQPLPTVNQMVMACGTKPSFILILMVSFLKSRKLVFCIFCIFVLTPCLRYRKQSRVIFPSRTFICIRQTFPKHVGVLSVSCSVVSNSLQSHGQ